MRNLAYYFTNPFMLAKLGLAVLIAFTTELIRRMTANNPEGKLDERIDAVSGALARLHSTFIDDGIQLGLRKGAKLEKRRFRDGLVDKIRPVYNAVWEAFGDPSPEMEEVFPGGRSVWYHLRDGEVSNHLNILVSGIAEYEASLGADVLAKAEAVRDEWAVVYEASKAASGEKTATEAGKRDARENLEVELYLTIARLMTLFPRDPERFALYMQQHLLEGKSGSLSSPAGDNAAESTGGSTRSSSSVGSSSTPDSSSMASFTSGRSSSSGS